MICSSAPVCELRTFASATGHRRRWGRRGLRWSGLLYGMLLLGGYEARQHPASGSHETAAKDAAQASLISEKTRMWMDVGEHRFAITLTDSDTARAFAAMLALTLEMSDLNSNEKFASLPEALPTHPSAPGTLRNGDLMLYGTDTLVVFYLTVNSSYAYTRLGRVDDPAGLSQALGSRDVRVVFSKD
ncbi:cyclophilin-like fold protein [Pseudomonas sp. LB1P83]